MNNLRRNFVFYFAALVGMGLLGLPLVLKIFGMLGVCFALAAWDAGLFRRLPLIGWAFERNPKRD